MLSLKNRWNLTKKIAYKRWLRLTAEGTCCLTKHLKERKGRNNIQITLSYSTITLKVKVNKNPQSEGKQRPCNPVFLLCEQVMSSSSVASMNPHSTEALGGDKVWIVFYQMHWWRFVTAHYKEIHLFGVHPTQPQRQSSKTDIYIYTHIFSTIIQRSA